MGRKAEHSVDDLLDVARALVLEEGAAAGAVAAIARAGDVSSGSLYHRFASRDELLARLWIRAVRRTQGRIVAASSELEDPVDGCVAAAVSVVDTCSRHRPDARLLTSFRREDLLSGPLPPGLAAELDGLNEPVEGMVRDLSRRLYGSAAKVHRDRVAMAVIDVPHGAVRRHLVADRPIPAATRTWVARATRAVVTWRPLPPIVCRPSEHDATMTTLLSAVPIIPARDLAVTAAWYARHLGFEVRHVEDEYAIVERDGVEVHFWGPSGIAPPESMTMFRVGVLGISALFDVCSKLGIVHPDAPLERKHWGTNEFATSDCDGNLITFFERS